MKKITLAKKDKLTLITVYAFGLLGLAGSMKFVHDTSKYESPPELKFCNTEVHEKRNFPIQGYDSRLYVSKENNQLNITPHGQLDSICLHRTYMEALFNKDNSIEQISYWGSRNNPKVLELSDSNKVREVYSILSNEKNADTSYIKIK